MIFLGFHRTPPMWLQSAPPTRPSLCPDLVLKSTSQRRVCFSGVGENRGNTGGGEEGKKERAGKEKLVSKNLKVRSALSRAFTCL